MPRKPNPTEVISFRIALDTAKQVNKYVKKRKTTRAKLAEALFLEAFDRVSKKETVPAS